MPVKLEPPAKRPIKVESPSSPNHSESESSTTSSPGSTVRAIRQEAKWIQRAIVRHRGNQLARDAAAATSDAMEPVMKEADKQIRSAMKRVAEEEWGEGRVKREATGEVERDVEASRGLEEGRGLISSDWSGSCVVISDDEDEVEEEEEEEDEDEDEDADTDEPFQRESERASTMPANIEHEAASHRYNSSDRLSVPLPSTNPDPPAPTPCPHEIFISLNKCLAPPSFYVSIKERATGLFHCPLKNCTFGTPCGEDTINEMEAHFRSYHKRGDAPFGEGDLKLECVKFEGIWCYDYKRGRRANTKRVPAPAQPASIPPTEPPDPTVPQRSRTTESQDHLPPTPTASPEPADNIRHPTDIPPAKQESSLQTNRREAMEDLGRLIKRELGKEFARVSNNPGPNVPTDLAASQERIAAIRRYQEENVTVIKQIFSQLQEASEMG
ncbi:hypothetical protein BJ508DRAFT_313508 [Ascobolus immersus RN42]|uniref:Uncharacterized protein n=1 Tax=Ascobolus immersus RN42 TaxID=1160509 RepID=A0A3N4HPI6_ASCIM|nr:hypothetical protein BJ508DRAFT_313508 [Ascobolus immersus RN42]